MGSIIISGETSANGGWIADHFAIEKLSDALGVVMIVIKSALFHQHLFFVVGIG